MIALIKIKGFDCLKHHENKLSECFKPTKTYHLKYSVHAFGAFGIIEKDSLNSCNSWSNKTTFINIKFFTTMFQHFCGNRIRDLPT